MQPGHKKLLRLSAVLLAVLYLATCAFFYCVMRSGPGAIVAVMNHAPVAVFMLLPFQTMWNHARGGHLNPGDRAPDFTLVRQDGKGQVTPGDLRGEKMVALIFGSYT